MRIKNLKKSHPKHVVWISSLLVTVIVDFELKWCYHKKKKEGLSHHDFANKAARLCSGKKKSREHISLRQMSNRLLTFDTSPSFWIWLRCFHSPPEQWTDLVVYVIVWRTQTHAHTQLLNRFRFLCSQWTLYWANDLISLFMSVFYFFRLSVDLQKRSRFSCLCQFKTHRFVYFWAWFAFNITHLEQSNINYTYISAHHLHFEHVYSHLIDMFRFNLKGLCFLNTIHKQTCSAWLNVLSSLIADGGLNVVSTGKKLKKKMFNYSYQNVWKKTRTNRLNYYSNSTLCENRLCLIFLNKRRFFSSYCFFFAFEIICQLKCYVIYFSEFELLTFRCTCVKLLCLQLLLVLDYREISK